MNRTADREHKQLIILNSHVRVNIRLQHTIISNIIIMVPRRFRLVGQLIKGVEKIFKFGFFKEKNHNCKMENDLTMSNKRIVRIEMVSVVLLFTFWLMITFLTCCLVRCTLSLSSLSLNV